MQDHHGHAPQWHNPEKEGHIPEIIIGSEHLENQHRIPWHPQKKKVQSFPWSLRHPTVATMAQAIQLAQGPIKRLAQVHRAQLGEKRVQLHLPLGGVLWEGTRQCETRDPKSSQKKKLKQLPPSACMQLQRSATSARASAAHGDTQRPKLNQSSPLHHHHGAV